jgi:hypothetical protein
VKSMLATAFIACLSSLSRPNTPSAFSSSMKKEILTISGLLVLLLGLGLHLFISGDLEAGKFTISVMTALGVISAVMFAAYGDQIKTLISPVRLRIEPVRNTDNFTNLNDWRGKGVENVITYHLLVRNLNANRVAKRCTVKLMQVLDENAHGEFVQSFRFAVPRSMVWAPAEDDPVEQSIHDFEILDLGNLFLSDGEFLIRYSRKQGGIFNGSCKLGMRRRYILKTQCEGSDKPQLFTVTLRPKAVTPTSDWPYLYTLDVEVQNG